MICRLLQLIDLGLFCRLTLLIDYKADFLFCRLIQLIDFKVVILFCRLIQTRLVNHRTAVYQAEQYCICLRSVTTRDAPDIRLF